MTECVCAYWRVSAHLCGVSVWVNVWTSVRVSVRLSVRLSVSVSRTEGDKLVPSCQ